MSKKEILFGLVLAILLAALLSPFASPWPDGLEKVAEIKGFLEKGEVAPVITSPIPDYVWPHIKSERLATAVAGIVGTLIVFGFAYALAALLRQRRS